MAFRLRVDSGPNLRAYCVVGARKMGQNILGRLTNALSHFSFLSVGLVHFSFKGCLSDDFHIYLNYTRTFCKQTVKILVKRCSLWRLIWVCTVFLYPKKGAGLLLGKTTDSHSRRNGQQKSVFVASDKARLKAISSTTETS